MKRDAEDPSPPAGAAAGPRADAVLDRAGLAALLGELSADGRTLLGPRVRDGAIVIDVLRGIEDLPAGTTDLQAPGRYRLESRRDGALFGHAVGPHSWKSRLCVPVLRLFASEAEGDGFSVEATPAESPRLALIGVRACDLAAIAVQDRILGSQAPGSFVDPDYAARRRDLFVVAVNCSDPGGTCFCASMGTGPRCGAGHDVVLTEIVDGAGHRFLAEAGSAAGRALLGRVPHQEADGATRRAADEVVQRAAGSMGRTMATDGIRDLLLANAEHPRWQAVAGRCLSCTSCTMVCPTCFCTAVTDVPDLAGTRVERVRRWDSCFTLDHSYLHGGSVRSSLRARYRQWLTHKLASWIDQFGTSGCVGCGRCITWCPAGIDITEEVAAIRATDARARGTP